MINCGFTVYIKSITIPIFLLIILNGVIMGSTFIVESKETICEISNEIITDDKSETKCRMNYVSHPPIKIDSNVDLVISDSSAFSKGFSFPKSVPHLCYLHTPTRYLWSSRDEYVASAPIPLFVRPFVKPVLEHHKRWDYIAAQNPDMYVANSRNIADRLKKYYDREASEILFPYVDTSNFNNRSIFRHW